MFLIGILLPLQDERAQLPGLMAASLNPRFPAVYIALIHIGLSSNNLDFGGTISFAWGSPSTSKGESNMAIPAGPAFPHAESETRTLKHHPRRTKCAPSL